MELSLILFCILYFQFSISIVIVFVLELVGGILTFIFLDRFQNHLITYMQKAIEVYQDDKDLKNALDYIQKTVSLSSNIPGCIKNSFQH